MDGEALRGIEAFVLLLAAAVVVALATRRLSIPYSVALVVAGFGMSLIGPFAAIHVDSELILAVMIPGLVFEAAYKIHLDVLRRSLGTVAVLAIPGVAITAAVVALAVRWTTGMDLGLAFLLGAIVCATDPVAVVAIFKQLRAPASLATTVEAESLFNDGTGVVLFAIALSALAAPVGLADGVARFAFTLVASGVLGLVAGYVTIRVMHLARDPLVEVMASIVAAYGIYLAAESLHQSGIIATVVAGILVGNPGGRLALSEATAAALDTAWETVSFLLTALVFLLVGVVITPAELGAAVPVIIVGYGAITAARALVVYGILGGGQRLLAGRGVTRLPVGHLHVMFWSGLRGAIAVALVLALPDSLPNHDLVAGGVYGIVLVTLLVQGTTASWVVRRTGVLEATDRIGAASDA